MSQFEALIRPARCLDEWRLDDSPTRKEAENARQEGRAIGEATKDLRSLEEKGMSKTRAAKISNAQAQKAQ